MTFFELLIGRTKRRVAVCKYDSECCSKFRLRTADDLVYDYENVHSS